MGRQTQRGWRTWVCSLSLLFGIGCSGFTLGPIIEKKIIIVRSGVPIEIVEQVEVEARVLKDEETSDIFLQDIGGWITMHPDHWLTVKEEIERLRAKVGTDGR